MTTSELLEKASGHRQLTIGGRNKRLLLFDNIETIASIWEQLPIERIFLSVPYLRVMEMSGLKDTQPYYSLVISEYEEVQAAFYYQVKLFKAEESIQLQKNEDVNGLQRIRRKLKRKLASQITFNTLVQGNLSVSGPFGHWIGAGLEQHKELIQKMAESVFKILRSEHADLKAILLKDYYNELPHKDSSFVQFEIQPAMEMAVDTGWYGFDDYISDLKSKYRVRYRKARERTVELEGKYVRAGQLGEQDMNRIYELYLNRAQVSDFNIATLHQDYFRNLNKVLPEQCIYRTYSFNGEIIAFMCMLEETDTLHAHFTGYEEALNKDHDLYLNLLYDVIATAIERKLRRICFARTAMEIKSGVGANPQELFCYMYYDSAVSQLFIPSIVKYLEPKKDWNHRQPFKA